jgi:hypothetical protein
MLLSLEKTRWSDDNLLLPNYLLLLPDWLFTSPLRSDFHVKQEEQLVYGGIIQWGHFPPNLRLFPANLSFLSVSHRRHSRHFPHHTASAATHDHHHHRRRMAMGGSADDHRPLLSVPITPPLVHI